MVWVCANMECPDISKYRQGDMCRKCGTEVAGLPLLELGRWANLKRGIAAMKVEEKREGAL